MYLQTLQWAASVALVAPSLTFILATDIAPAFPIPTQVATRWDQEAPAR